MADQGADERKQLMDKFLADLASGNNAFYDEDDLVELYDYAADNDDDYARMEVLLCAARMYPDSEPLSERKAYYYYELGNDAAARTALARLPRNSVLARLLKLLLDKPEEKVALKELDDIVDTTDDFEDEWVIQLVTVASQLNLYEWLKKRYDYIKAKSGYPQSFIYEMLGVAEYAGDYDTAESLAEELTMLEPFNSEFWEVLAEIHINHLGQYEKGLSDVEYALAINPDSVRALLFKGQVLSELGRPIEQIMEPLARASQIAPDDPLPANYLAMSLFNAGYTLEAIQTLEDFRKEHPDDYTTIEYLVLLCKGIVADDVLDALFVNYTEDTVMHWKKVAQRFASEEEFEAAAAVMRAIARQSILLCDIEFLFEVLYRTRRYSEIVEHWKKLSDDEYTPRTIIADMLFVYSAYRIGNTELLAANIGEIYQRWNTLDRAESFARRMARSGALYLFEAVKESLESGSTFDIDTYDPFNQ